MIICDTLYCMCVFIHFPSLLTNAMECVTAGGCKSSRDHSGKDGVRVSRGGARARGTVAARMECMSAGGCKS